MKEYYGPQKARFKKINPILLFVCNEIHKKLLIPSSCYVCPSKHVKTQIGYPWNWLTSSISKDIREMAYFSLWSSSLAWNRWGKLYACVLVWDSCVVTMLEVRIEVSSEFSLAYSFAKWEVSDWASCLFISATFAVSTIAKVSSLNSFQRLLISTCGYFCGIFLLCEWNYKGDGRKMEMIIEGIVQRSWTSLFVVLLVSL